MKRVAVIVGWALALALAAALDRPVASWVFQSGIATTIKSSRLDDVLKSPGHIFFTLALAAVLVAAHRWRWSLLVLLAGVISGVNQIIKLVAGRYRPMKVPGHPDEILPFDLHPFTSEKNLSFPSGHATLAFATAAMMARLMPRWRWVWYALASMVAAERVLEGAHYLSDAVAAALVGILSAHLAWWLWRRYAQGNEQPAGNLAGDPLLQRAGEYSGAAQPRGGGDGANGPGV
jgi:membrane-associated phospholipid phosphatase